MHLESRTSRSPELLIFLYINIIIIVKTFKEHSLVCSTCQFADVGVERHVFYRWIEMIQVVFIKRLSKMYIYLKKKNYTIWEHHICMPCTFNKEVTFWHLCHLQDIIFFVFVFLKRHDSSVKYFPTIIWRKPRTLTSMFLPLKVHSEHISPWDRAGI